MNKLKAIFLACLVLLTIVPVINQKNIQSTSAQEVMDFSGQTEGTGTSFEIEDSEYLNLALESSEEIRILFESIPKMISLDIDSVDDNIDSTDLILAGLIPNKTYYKYENSYGNLVEFVADVDGTYSWTQEINEPHHVWIQEIKSTISLPADCHYYGTWNPDTSTCTLNQNLTGSVNIIAHDVTLDCAGHKISGTGPNAHGIVITLNDITVKNCTITNFYNGIVLYRSNGIKIINNDIHDNSCGIGSNYVDGSLIEGNTISNNNRGGISFIYDSSNNEIKNNVVSFSNEKGGIYFSGHNELICKNNLIVENDISNNNYGFHVVHSTDNEIYHNNFIDNDQQVYQFGASTINYNNTFDNGFNGGNYWNDFDGCADIDNDGICDNSYVFDGGQDNYPFVKRYEWETANTDISITSTPLEFFNDNSPFLPNILEIRAKVRNEGNVRIDSMIIQFALDGELIGEKFISSIEPNRIKFVEMIWEPTSSVENKTLKVEAILINQTDSDLSNNVIEQPISFHWVDFHYDEDAFSFSNEDWEYDYFDELGTVFNNNGIVGKARTLLGGFILAYTDSRDGHCYGMAAASTHWYIAPQDKPRQIDTFEMNLGQEDVKANIINHHWSQIFYKAKFLKNVFASYKPQEHYNAILQDIKSGLPVVVGLGESWSLSGHAVTAYSILDIGNEKRIHVYDNERPLKKMSIVNNYNSATFKVSSNEADYIGFDRVMYVPKEYSLFPSSLDFADLTEIAIQQLWDDKKMFFWEHSPADPLVTDEFNRRTGYVGDTFYDEIPGAEVRKVDDTYLFYLPLELTYSIEMVGTDTGNVGVDFVIPISESQSEVVSYKDIPVTLGSQINAAVNPTELTYQIISETGEVITPDDEGKLDANFVFSAKWLKEKAKQSLEQAKTGDNRIDIKINRVIENITKSLQDNLWQDEIYLDSEDGRKVFEYEIVAITKMKLYLYLSEYLSYHKLPENVIIAFEQAIEDLVAADEILAQVILNEAKNTPVNNPRYQDGFDILIAKAEENIEQANQYSVDNPARAVFKYGFSWHYSQKAIKYASKN